MTPDRLLIDGRQHVRAVGADNHLQRWEGLAQQIDNLLLPTRMQVHVDLVDEQHPWGLVEQLPHPGGGSDGHIVAQCLR